MAELVPQFTAPLVITIHHQCSEFNSGEPALDDWLRTRALDNLAAGASRSYVTCRSGTLEIAAYYALAMASISSSEVPGSMRRNMPNMIPAVMLGRLAVDRACQGHGLGATMLKDAVLRAMRAAGEISARLVLVQALSPAAEAFYRHHGFTRLSGDLPTFALDLVRFAKLGAARSQI